MSIAELRSILDTLDEASCCSGVLHLDERIALMLPNGDVGAVDDSIFVDWLLEHSEAAPYGQGTVTKVDPKVRSARRLTARGEIQIRGFDGHPAPDRSGDVADRETVRKAHRRDHLQEG